MMGLLANSKKEPESEFTLNLYEVQHEVLWRRSENKIWKSLEIKNNFAFKVWNIFMGHKSIYGSLYIYH